MAPQYAKDQPAAGFVNRIEKVAIVGAGGQVGKYVAEALVKTGKHTVTAITRADSTSRLPEGVRTATVDYDDEQSLVDALGGQQCLIITMSVAAPPDTHSKLIRAAAKAGVPYVMPNWWGSDPLNEKLSEDVMMGKRFANYCQEIESLGVSKWVAVACGFWYEFSLGGTEDRYGFDFGRRSVVFFDDGTARINTSTWPQCGRAVAAFLSLKWLPEDETDKDTGGPTVDGFANGAFYVSSFLVSQRDMFESVKRVTGTSDGDWTVGYEDSGERYRKGVEAIQQGDFGGFVRLLYTRVFYPNGDGDYESSKGLQNDILGLPKEDLDEATREAIRFSQSGDLGAHYVK